MNEQDHLKRIERAKMLLRLGGATEECINAKVRGYVEFAEHEIELAGAASVDRVAIVREAFAKVKFTYCNGTWPKKPYDIAVIAVMDAVLAEMEKGK